MENVFEPMLDEQLLYERRICDRTFNEFHASGNLVPKTAAQIIQSRHAMSLAEQLGAHMGADEPRRASDQNR